MSEPKDDGCPDRLSENPPELLGDLSPVQRAEVKLRLEAPTGGGSGGLPPVVGSTGSTPTGMESVMTPLGEKMFAPTEILLEEQCHMDPRDMWHAANERQLMVPWKSMGLPMEYFAEPGPAKLVPDGSYKMRILPPTEEALQREAARRMNYRPRRTVWSPMEDGNDSFAWLRESFGITHREFVERMDKIVNGDAEKLEKLRTEKKSMPKKEPWNPPTTRNRKKKK